MTFLELIFEAELTPFQDVIRFAPVVPLSVFVCLRSVPSPLAARAIRVFLPVLRPRRAAPGEKKRGEPASVLGPLARH